jgi:hypothetical protein
MNLRPRLSYANVVATLALVLALGGGTVYAAIKLGKNDVKSKNIANGQVKSKDLGKNAVKSAKVKDGAIQEGDLAAGIFDGIGVDVTGTASSGSRGGLNANTESPLALAGDTSFTPAEGEVAAIAAEGRFTTAVTDPAQFCSPNVRLLVNGQPTRVFVNPSGEQNTTTPETTVGRDADGPFGLLEPGEPITVTATIEGDVDCTADTTLDALEVRILQIR